VQVVSSQLEGSSSRREQRRTLVQPARPATAATPTAAAPLNPYPCPWHCLLCTTAAAVGTLFCCCCSTWGSHCCAAIAAAQARPSSSSSSTGLKERCKRRVASLPKVRTAGAHGAMPGEALSVPHAAAVHVSAGQNQGREGSIAGESVTPHKGCVGVQAVCGACPP
jgi:hypothetical protein